MDVRISRRGMLQSAAVASAALSLTPPAVALPRWRRVSANGGISGRMTGAQAVVAALKQQNVGCVFGIPGAQENELWDEFKSGGIGYILVTHEFSAAAMADGYSRSTGCPGVISVVPGPGLTNSLSGLGEALLDSIPIVALIGDVGVCAKAHAFQVHSLDQVALAKPVTKGVFVACKVEEIPCEIQRAFALAQSGEPGPVGVVIPYNLLIESAHMQVGPPEAPNTPFDEAAVARAIDLLASCRGRVGIYAGLGCMNYSQQVVEAAELLQAPVATSISGKGVIPESHPLAVGWGYGPQGTATAERAFEDVDCLLAIGVRYSEVSTGYYSNPRPKRLIHVDANPSNLGRVLPADVCVPADAGLFLDRLLACCDRLRRPADGKLRGHIQKWKRNDLDAAAKNYGKCGVDPMQLVLSLRRNLGEDALLFVDVSLAEHLAAEAYTTCRPRSYFCPTDNQAMGWSIPAAIGAQSAHPGQCVVTLTGDGCFLMSAMEASTAARTGLPVKFFVLDNQAYQYMQSLQMPAYARTTATVLANLNYPALAQGLGLAYSEIQSCVGLDESVRGALCQHGPVLIRVVTDYGDRPIRWLDAVQKKYTKELTFDQKARFLGRVTARSVQIRQAKND